ALAGVEHEAMSGEQVLGVAERDERVVAGPEPVEGAAQPEADAHQRGEGGDDAEEVRAEHVSGCGRGTAARAPGRGCVRSRTGGTPRSRPAPRSEERRVGK